MYVRDGAPIDEATRKALELAIDDLEYGGDRRRAILNLNHRTLVTRRRAALDSERIGDPYPEAAVTAAMAEARACTASTTSASARAAPPRRRSGTRWPRNGRRSRTRRSRPKRDCARRLCRSEGATAHDRAGATALTGDGGVPMFKQAIQNLCRRKGDS